MFAGFRPAFKYRSNCDEADAPCLYHNAFQKMQPKKVWRNNFEMISEAGPHLNELVAMATYQFHYHPYVVPRRHQRPKTCFSWRKLYCKKWEGEKKEFHYDQYIGEYDALPRPMDLKNICYPHEDLDVTFKKFRKHNVRFIPSSLPQQIEVLKRQYERIRRFQYDDEMWLVELKSTKDHQFIIDNVEYRLGGNLDNCSLWKMYIEYLKNSGDVETLLQTFSKYCRYFEDDQEVLADYQWYAETNPPVAVPWINPFPFEEHCPNFFDEKPKKYERFNGKRAFRQLFSLPLDQMACIRENASASVLFKLYQSCKWFPMRFPATICYKLSIDNYYIDVYNVKYGGNSMRITSKEVPSMPYKKLIISEELYIGPHLQDTMLLSKFLPNVCSSSANKISIYDQKLKMEELRLLVKAGNVASFTFHMERHQKSRPLVAANSNQADFFVEDLLALMPCLQYLSLRRIQCTPKTFKPVFQFKKKIWCLRLEELQNENLVVEDFAKFVVTNCFCNATIELTFHSTVKLEYISNIQKTIVIAARKRWGPDEDIKIECKRV